MVIENVIGTESDVEIGVSLKRKKFLVLLHMLLLNVYYAVYEYILVGQRNDRTYGRRYKGVQSR